jgi:hypothetical protein
MAETQNAPKSIEVNDAMFCGTHYKEVVRSDPRIRILCLLSACQLHYSVLIVTSTGEKRMIRSLGWVSPSHTHGGGVLMKPSFNSVRISLV